MKKLFILGTFLFISSIPMVSCTDDDDKDPNFMPPDIVMGGGDVESEYPEDLPAPGASVMYTPSLNANMYRPISVKYSSAYPPISSWKTENTRIIAYMDGYKPAIKTLKAYQESVNKYGSSTTLPKQAATGRFYTKKIDGRWWFRKVVCIWSVVRLLCVRELLVVIKRPGIAGLELMRNGYLLLNVN